MFKPYNPDWFYSPVNLPQLVEIQKEIFEIYEKSFKNKNHSILFGVINREQIQTPITDEVFRNLGLGHKWYNIGLSILQGPGSFPVHIDYSTGKDQFLAINIPILNCDGTHIVWYDSELENPVNSYGPNEEVSYSIDFTKKYAPEATESTAQWWCKNNIELLRAECTVPMLVHIGRPHSPISSHNKIRLLASIRFKPELTQEDLDKLGILDKVII